MHTEMVEVCKSQWVDKKKLGGHIGVDKVVHIQ
jgi:hypothetical protein